MRKKLLFEENPKDIHLYAHCNKRYFENLPIIGNLDFYKNGFDYDGEPIIYFCKDDKNKLYLCHVIELRYILETLITPISRWDVFKLFINKISIRSFYNKSKIIYYANSQDGFFVTNKEEVKEWLPDEDVYLDYFEE